MSADRGPVQTWVDRDGFNALLSGRQKAMLLDGVFDRQIGDLIVVNEVVNSRAQAPQNTGFSATFRITHVERLDKAWIASIEAAK